MAPTDEERQPATSVTEEAVDEATETPEVEEAVDAPPQSVPGASADSRPLRWLRSRRRRGLRVAIRYRRRLRRNMTVPRIDRASAALSAILAALLASAGWHFMVGPPPTSSGEPTGLVSDYLEALLDGDTEAAMEIAGVSKPPADDEFLTAEALSADWRIDSLTANSDVYTEGTTAVRVRISDEAGRSTRGEFLVEPSPSGGHRITNPFAYVQSTAEGAPSYLDLNGTAAAVTSTRDGVTAMPVFPGSYELYSKNKSLFTVSPGKTLLLPQGIGGNEKEVPQNLVFDVSVTGKGQRSAQKTLTAMVNECADSDELAPSDCPFNAEDDMYPAAVTTDEQYFTDVEGVSWKVTEPPKVTLHGYDSHFGLSLRNDTAITLSGTGVPMFGDDDEKAVEFTVDCPYDIGGVIVNPTASGGFTLTMSDAGYRASECELR